MKELTTQPTVDESCPGITDGYALLELVRGWLKQGNPVVAGDLLNSAIRSREADRDPKLRGQILKETGRARMMQTDWDAAEAYYLEAQRVFLDLGEFKGAAECARNRANMYFQKGKYAQSDELCRQALEWATQLSDYELRATILNTLGAIQSATGELREAIQTLQLCLADFESSGNQIRQGYVLLNIGLTHTELGEYDEAISRLNQALAISLSEKDLNLVEICYQNIAKCYFARNETNLAKSVIDTARKILPGLNSQALEAELNVIDCRILRAMGQLETADKLLDKTQRMATDNNLAGLTADVLFEQAHLALDRGRSTLAESKLRSAADQFKQLGMDKRFQEAIQLLKQLKRQQ